MNPHPERRDVTRLSRMGARLAVAGAVLGVGAGLLELTLGSHVRSWIGGKQDTTRLGLATIVLAAIALVAAVVWLRRMGSSTGAHVLILVGLLVPAAICFTTAGRAWFLPGTLLVIAACGAAFELRGEGAEVRDTVQRGWLGALTAILAALYVVLGATSLGIAGALGVLGGTAILISLAVSSRMPPRARQIVLIVAALPFAVATWWSVVTPLLAILVIAIGWPALAGVRGVSANSSLEAGGAEAPRHPVVRLRAAPVLGAPPISASHLSDGEPPSA